MWPRRFIASACSLAAADLRSRRPSCWSIPVPRPSISAIASAAVALRLPASAAFRYHRKPSAASRAMPVPAAYIRPSRYITWVLPLSASRRSICRKSPSSPATRHTSTRASLPGVIADTRWRRSFMLATTLPFRPTMMSPKRMPAWAAGAPATALRRNAPSPLARPSESASGSSRGSISTPSQPFSASLGWLPSLTGTLSRRPCGWAGSLDRGGSPGVCCTAGIAGLPPPGGRCGMRTMLTPESATF